MSNNVTPRIWLASDWHFDHEKLLETGAREAGYETKLVDNLILSLQPQDILIHLGDAAIYNRGKERVTNLLHVLKSKGVKVWNIRGNHDPHMLRCIGMGFQAVMDSCSFQMFGKNILLTHVPADREHMGSVPMVAGKDTKNPTDYIPYDVNIHGHLHTIEGHGIRGDFYNDGKHILISSELCDYRPILLERALRFRIPKWENYRFVEGAPPMVNAGETVPDCRVTEADIRRVQTNYSHACGEPGPDEMF